MVLTNLLIIIRGAGEMASALAWRLHKSHFRVILIEREEPLAVRRQVSFCEAVYEGVSEVEGVTAKYISNIANVSECFEAGEIPLLIDPDLKSISSLKADVLVEATLSKRNLGITKNLAPLVIGLGPGFSAGVDTDLVIETNRGHNLGRVITKGEAEPNTGNPGTIAGKTLERVFRAPADGIFKTHLELGSMVKDNQELARVSNIPILSQTSGIIRGLIRPESRVTKGVKVGDVDPRGDISYLNTISDKARAVAGAVLEGILRYYNK